MRALRAWFILGRVSNLPTVWTNVLAAWVLTGGPLTWSAQLAWLLLGVSLLYVGGTTMNDFADAAFDREYRKERPIPSGILSRATVGFVGALYILTGALAVMLGAHGVWYHLVGLIGAILIYTHCHKRWVGSVFFMGACRLFLSLLAASCLTTSLSTPVMVHAVCLFGYIVGLTFTARGESRESQGPCWPLALLGLPFAGALYIEQSLLVLVFGGLFLGAVVMSLKTLIQRTDPARIGKAVALMLAGIALADAAFLASHSLAAALLGLVGFALALLAQRFVPAT
jgi:hypothetical protein